MTLSLLTGLHCPRAFIIRRALSSTLGQPILDLVRRIGVGLKIEQVQPRKEQLGTIRDGLFVLVSLLLGFTLTLAASRFAERRSLLVEEAISIGTTYLRTSMLPAPYRDHSRQLLREYVDARLELAEGGADAARFNEALNRSRRIQDELWVDAVMVSQNDRTAIAAVYVKLFKRNHRHSREACSCV